jgi:hypothetical protein
MTGDCFTPLAIDIEGPYALSLVTAGLHVPFLERTAHGNRPAGTPVAANRVLAKAMMEMRGWMAIASHSRFPDHRQNGQG